MAAQTLQKAQVCLVNSMEFPEASSEINTLNKKEKIKIRIFLGSENSFSETFLKVLHGDRLGASRILFILSLTLDLIFITRSIVSMATESLVISSIYV